MYFQNWIVQAPQFLFASYLNTLTNQSFTLQNDATAGFQTFAVCDNGNNMDLCVIFYVYMHVTHT